MLASQQGQGRMGACDVHLFLVSASASAVAVPCSAACAAQQSDDMSISFHEESSLSMSSVWFRSA